MGWLGWIRGCLITIESTPTKGEDLCRGLGLVLTCGKENWAELYEISTKLKSIEMMAKSQVATVVVEGPYCKLPIGQSQARLVNGCLGGSGHTVWESYSAVVFVCKEDGISFALPVIRDLLEKSPRTGCVQHIVFIWSVQNPSEFQNMLKSD